MLHDLVKAACPAKPLVAAVRDLYRRTSDARFLATVLPALPKAEVLHSLPALVGLPQGQVRHR